jgi:hypothetical protein
MPVCCTIWSSSPAVSSAHTLSLAEEPLCLALERAHRLVADAAVSDRSCGRLHACPAACKVLLTNPESAG